MRILMILYPKAGEVNHYRQTAIHQALAMKENGNGPKELIVVQLGAQQSSVSMEALFAMGVDRIIPIPAGIDEGMDQTILAAEVKKKVEKQIGKVDLVFSERGEGLPQRKNDADSAPLTLAHIREWGQPVLEAECLCEQPVELFSIRMPQTLVVTDQANGKR